MTPQTTAAVLLGVMVLGAAAIYLAKKKDANDAYDVATKGRSIDYGVRSVGGTLLNRDGSKATADEVIAATQKGGGVKAFLTGFKV